jgi:hypothetical protein
MTTRPKATLLLFSLCSLCFLSSSSPARAEAPAAADVEKVSKSMASDARKFLDTLSPAQLATAGFEFKDNERQNWHFIPKPRKGLTLKDMSEDQRALAKAMLAHALSEQADTKVLTIMSLENILRDMEQGKGPKRDPEVYYWSIFGNPTAGDSTPWGWRVEGHHVSMNFTIVDGKTIAVGPAFLGANPAEVRQGPRKGLRVLAEEEDMGRAFMKSLSEDQQKKALISKTAPKEIVTGAERQAVLQKFEGIAYSDLTDQQKAGLMNLISLYANRLRPELAQDDLQRINKAGLDKIYFAWAGVTEVGKGHYYRIHGPNFLVEYDDTQNDANHIHTVWRDLENDFGGDVLKRHYEESHK